MSDALGSLLRLDTGLARVVRGVPVAVGALPARSQFAPPEATFIRHLDRFMNAGTLDETVQRALQPALYSADVLRPDRFQAALDVARTLVDDVIEQAAPGAPREALQGLGDVLRRRQEMLESLHYFRDMLIAG
jgi:hypothetical protein